MSCSSPHGGSVFPVVEGGCSEVASIPTIGGSASAQHDPAFEPGHDHTCIVRQLPGRSPEASLDLLAATGVPEFSP